MIKKLLSYFGYYKIEYGFCGMDEQSGHRFMMIDGKEVSPRRWAKVKMPSEEIRKLAVGVLGVKEWDYQPEHSDGKRLIPLITDTDGHEIPVPIEAICDSAEHLVADEN